MATDEPLPHIWQVIDPNIAGHFGSSGTSGFQTVSPAPLKSERQFVADSPESHSSTDVPSRASPGVRRNLKDRVSTQTNTDCNSTSRHALRRRSRPLEASRGSHKHHICTNKCQMSIELHKEKERERRASMTRKTYHIGHLVGVQDPPRKPKVVILDTARDYIEECKAREARISRLKRLIEGCKAKRQAESLATLLNFIDGQSFLPVEKTLARLLELPETNIRPSSTSKD